MGEMSSPPEETTDLAALLDTYYPTAEPIAVIGYACRLPQAPDSEAFWNNLCSGRDCSERFSTDALRTAGIDPETIAAPDFVGVGAVISDADRFDAGLFGYSRQQAEAIDPQQRLFLQTVWHALEHGGYAPRDVPHRTGVFGSARASTYPGYDRMALGDVAQARGLQSLVGNDKDYVATRVAYELNLRGPALSVQTACSSSLVAVHLACESLRSGECDMAVAGGVAVSFPQHVGYRHQPGMIFSPDGRCRPFDVAAQGTFPGHGVAAVTLRRLEDALRDGDPIAAVILGSAINNDGDDKAGFTAPSVCGQSTVIRDALTLSGITPEQIGMIEAHGTATPLGDPIEVRALRQAFGTVHTRCALGSVKGNCGHLDTAAGITSLLKTVLSVERATIPPSLNFTAPNPALDLEKSPFYVPDTARAWRSSDRVAGVSSFGIGGTNCHMIIASLPEALGKFTARISDPAPDTTQDPSDILLLSAASDRALRQIAGAYAQALSPETMRDVATTALHGRQLDLDHRLAIALGPEIPAALAAFACGDDDILLHHGQGTPGKQLWLFSGQGTHWPGMCRTFHEHSSAFATALDRCIAACDRVLPISLGMVVLGEREDLLVQMQYAQPAIVAFEIAMAAHWQSLGLAPDMVIGHSVGEYAAAVVAGFLDLQQVMPLVCQRGAMMDSCDDGAMVSVNVDETQASALARQFDLDLAACNGTRRCVLSGAAGAIDRLLTMLDISEIRHVRLDVSGAPHSRLLDPILDRFQAEAKTLRAKPGTITLISTLTGRPIDAEALNAPDYWRRHMREPVRFADAVRHAIDLGAGLGLEVGPDGPLTRIAAADHPQQARWIASARRHRDATSSLGEALMQLFAAGAVLPWRTLLTPKGRKTRAPLYHFDTDRFWSEGAPTPVVGMRSIATQAALAEGKHVADEHAPSLELDRLETFYDRARQLHAIYVDRLVQRSAEHFSKRGATLIDILRGGRLLPRYRQLLRRLLDGCVEDGYYRIVSERYEPDPSKPVPHAQCDELLEEFRLCCEGLDVIAETVGRAGAALHAMMSGAVDPVAVIFPEGASHGVEVLYQEFSFGRYFNQIAGGVLAGRLRSHDRRANPSAPFHILEVGGGTGGTTAWLLPHLVDEPAVRYTFTDISPIFTRRAEEKFARYDFLSYAQFDLQADPAAQGFEAASFDLIVAANVVHATQHVGKTLGMLGTLLKPGGMLLLREITRPMRLFDFVFGPLVLPLHDEEARGGELFLTTELWRQHALAAGFAQVDWLPEDGAPTSGISEHIILATMPEHAATPAPALCGPRDPLLGLALTEDGLYLADWRQCAGRPDLWRQHLADAARALALRHGGAEDRAAYPADAALPDPLEDVRLRWLGGAFGAGRITVETRDSHGNWQPVAADPSTKKLPRAIPAPDTQYEWVWRTPRAPISSGPAIACDHADVAAALREAGITVDPAATLRLITIDPAAPTPTEAIAPVLAALADTGTVSLLVTTHDAWAIDGTEVVSPPQRSVWGLLRVAAVEYPHRVIAAVDLTHPAEWRDLVPAVAAASGGARWIAARGGKILEQSLARQTHVAPSLPPDSLAGGGWHVVTGGFGGLGRLTAAWLIAQGARHVAILAPRAPEGWPQDDAEAAFRWVPCDMADPSAVTASLDMLHDDGGVEGVIHAAGVLDDAPLSSLDTRRLATVLAVKADAAVTLHAWLAAHRGRYLILYSSAAASLGAAGQAAHATASAALDGLAAAHRDERSPVVISIAWGAWSGTGRAASDALRARLAEGGMGELSPAEGLWHLEQAVTRGVAGRIAMRLLPERLDPARHRLLLDCAPDTTSAPPSRSADTQVPASIPSCDDIDALTEWLRRIVAAQVRLSDPSRLDTQCDLIRLGVDSLLFLELRSTIEKTLGVRLDGASISADLSISALAEAIARAAGQDVSPAVKPALVHNAADRFEPFPLTPIQHAYWLGRTTFIAYGGVACHILFEWDKTEATFDLNRFETAWNALVQRHDMLRMVVAPDGRQRVLRDVAAYRIARRDLSAMSAADREASLASTREEMSRDVLPADRWPLFRIVASNCGDGRYRLHMHLDLLLFDVQSLKVMMDDLARAYHGAALEPLAITFRDHVMAEERQRSQAPWRRSWRFWQERLADLPPAPRLPLAPARANRPPTVTTRAGRLERAEWERLKTRWREWGATPSAGLLALYAHVLEAWSRQPEFTLNLTFFNRPADHPQMMQIIGDFTSVLLIDCDLSVPQTLHSLIAQMQAKLWQALQHGDVNGVEVLREIGRISGHGHQPQMPVVFTSMLGMSLEGQSIDQAMTNLLGDPVHVFTQTPQVWLDHQAMEIDGALVFHWYCMDDVLAEGVGEAMFAAYVGLLQAIAAEPALMEEERPSSAGVPHGPLHPAIAEGARPDAATGLAPRTIEAALRARDDIARAEASFSEDGSHIEIVIVASDARENTPETEPKIAPPALSSLPQSELASIERAWTTLEARALEGLTGTLRGFGLFVRPGARHTLDEIVTALQAKERHRRLIGQWLAKLTRQGWLRQDGDAFVAVRALPVAPSTRPGPSDADWAGVLLGYLDRCIAGHAALFADRLSPLQLVFENDGAVARALYSDNPVSRHLNDCAAQYVRALAIAHAEKLLVLEIGAGTGATTQHLLPALGERVAQYRFTDVSPLFLDEARDRFGAHPAMRYALFDVNAPAVFEDHPRQGYDLVVAANVLHDATHVVRALRRVGRLLKPGGWLLLIEATEPDSALQLASIGFIEGLNGYQDFRAENEQALLDTPSWRRVLGEAGFDVVTCWPTDDATPLRQHFVVARAIRTGRLDLDEVERDLRARFPDTLPTLVLRQAETLPAARTADEKNDGSEGDAAPSDATTSGTRASPVDDERVAEIWRDYLGRTVGPGTDFFRDGGDSLIATRMIAKLAQNGYSHASLGALFRNPEFSAFCATLKPPAITRDTRSVLLAAGERPGRAFVFHASDGGLAAYLPLARELGCEVRGFEAAAPDRAESIEAMALTYVMGILDAQPRGPFLLIGWSYGAFVAAEAARILGERGEMVDLVLLDPVRRRDFAISDRTGLLRLMAREHGGLTLPDDFETRDADGQTACFLDCLAAAAPEFRMPDAQARTRIETMDVLFGMLATHSAPAAPDANCLWIGARDRPPHWGPAEEDWGDIKARAVCHLMETDHWSLVMSDIQARNVAGEIIDWHRGRRA